MKVREESAGGKLKAGKRPGKGKGIEIKIWKSEGK